MDCKRTTLEQLRCRAVAIMNFGLLDGRAFTQADLEKAILDTGYAGCENADKNTAQCLELYLRNLGSSGRSGPSGKYFEELTRKVFSELVDQNSNKIQPLTIEDLADVYLELSGYNNNVFTAKKSNTNYVSQLKQIKFGTQLKRKETIYVWLKSIKQFVDYLSQDYEGDVQIFTDLVRSEFSTQPDNYSRFKYTWQRGKDLSKIYGLGHPLASNFLKDLFACEFNKNKTLSDQLGCYSAWCLKLDRHVVRLMSVITEREAFSAEIVSKNENLVKKSYKESKNSTWLLSENTSADDSIAYDVFALADVSESAPLEIDRILYMCASGDFNTESIGDKIKAYTHQVQRYEMLLTGDLKLRKVIEDFQKHV